MKALIQKLIAHENLSRAESYTLISQLTSVPLEQQGAIMALFAAKNETVDELLGARDFLFEHTRKIECDLDVIDICGTGGDGIGTFNISTAASLVVASCGVPVAKHGGRSATSQSGSMDLVEVLGITLSSQPEIILQSLVENQYAYLSAPLFNIGFKAVRSIRNNLGFPTLFNILGPLLNPMQVKRQLIGVNRKDRLCKFAQMFQQMGSVHTLIVYSEDGLDELSVSSVTHVVELHNGIIKEYQVNPDDVGLSYSTLHEVLGGTPKENAEIITGIFSGKILGAKLDIVLLNSAAALLVADVVDNLKDGVMIARNAIQSGKAMALLNKLQENR